jgi:hypothetical protein
MEWLDSLKLALRPSYEVSSESFYRSNLNPFDAISLREFVQDFGNMLSLPSAILAVGSSVFPAKHWEGRKKLNKRDPTIKAPENYQDIDLLIIPEKITKLDDLEHSVQKTLQELRYGFTSHKSTTAGVSYSEALAFSDKGEKAKKIVCSYVHMDYGLHSITTKLKSATKLDLILGRDDLLKQTAAEKILEERKGKYAFSLLYSR